MVGFVLVLLKIMVQSVHLTKQAVELGRELSGFQILAIGIAVLAYSWIVHDLRMRRWQPEVTELLSSLSVPFALMVGVMGIAHAFS